MVIQPPQVAELIHPFIHGERERERLINDQHQNKIIADFLEYFWRINKIKYLSLCKDIIIVSTEIILKNHEICRQIYKNFMIINIISGSNQYCFVSISKSKFFSLALYFKKSITWKFTLISMSINVQTEQNHTFGNRGIFLE